MNRTGGAPKAVAKLDSTDLNFDLDDRDQFGISVAGIGDLNGDGVNDIAVGAPTDDAVFNNTGALHILYLNRDGSTNGSFEINQSVISTIGFNDQFGISVANLGDLNRDGINDLAVGAAGDDTDDTGGTGGTDRGAIYILFMNKAGTAPKAVAKLDSTNPNFDLNDENQFGISVANIGDLDGDGINELVVGAPGDNAGGNDTGALYILYMDSETVVTDVTSAAENRIYDTGTTIDIQVIFSEAVDVDATGETPPTLTLETGSIDTQASYIGKLVPRILTFAYTVASRRRSNRP